MTDYRIEAATKEEWAERALRAEANAMKASNAAFLEKRRADEAEAKRARSVEALESVLGACDEGRMIPRLGHGAGGMTIEANIKGSVYTGVPAWPIEEARTTLAELKGETDGR